MAKVLLVEDDNNLREIYQARLQAEGYDIAAAADGEEALVVAKQEQPDLVISDVMMPKISGFEMLDILRNTQGLENVKVIMLTALGQAEDQTRADSLGADRYLVKSQVTLEDIVTAAQDLLTEAGALAPVEPPAPAVPDPVAAVPPAQPVAMATPPVELPTAPEPAQMPAPAAEPAAPVAEPAVAPTPVVADTPTTAPPADGQAAPVDPVIATPMQPVTAIADDNTPIIPLASAPPDEPTDTVSPSMPPTAESTIPEMPGQAATQPAASEPVSEPAAPVAAEPITTSGVGSEAEPLPAPEPAPVAEPAVMPTVDQPNQAEEATDVPQNPSEPQTEAQETAVVEQQIEAFVNAQNGAPAATVEPSITPGTETAAGNVAPLVAVDQQPTPAEVPAAEPAAAPEQPAPAMEATPPVAPQTTPEQEQALNDALTNLGGSPSAPTPEPAPTPAASEVPAGAPMPAPSAVEPSQPSEPVSAGGVSGKKVIAPLGDTGEPKKDINELLAAEDAKEANQPRVTGQQPGGIDPNSIAL